MSEEINNREYRQQVIKELISQLHGGAGVDEVKEKFAAVFAGVSAEEISQAEQALIADGLPVSEVQRLCDVHAAVFKGSIEEIHHTSHEWEQSGHPVHTLKLENRALETLIAEIRKNLNSPSENSEEVFRFNFEKLKQINRHYLKKENLLFPFMEHYGITAPPKVMWGVHDEIRTQLKTAANQLTSSDRDQVKEEIESLLNKMTEMIFKEENIMLPMLVENLTQDEWKQIADESGEIGYFLLEDVPAWTPSSQKEASSLQTPPEQPGVLTLPTGVLKLEELIRMLDTLPIDITFVDKDDTVKYFSQGAERIFPRTKSVIGRKVSNCHPPASVHIVEKLVDDFKSGAKDHEDFWIHMGEKFILIRYFAVRDENGQYVGTLEVTQNIKSIQEIQGEKRLVSE